MDPRIEEERARIEAEYRRVLESAVDFEKRIRDRWRQKCRAKSGRIAERLYAFLHAAELNITEDTLEALTLFMAQQREHLGTILKGGRPKMPAGSAQPAALPQDKRAESSPSEPKSSKASQGAPTTKPKAAA